MGSGRSRATSVTITFFFLSEFHLHVHYGTEPYVALPLQVVMGIYFGHLTVRGTAPMHDLGHRCVTREKGGCKSGGYSTPGGGKSRVRRPGLRG